MIQRTSENTPLALLAEPTDQQVFDAVVAHAAQMPERCYEFARGCVYRGSGGNACFVGALLTDEEAKGLDRSTPLNASELIDHGLMPARLVPHRKLLQRLQEVHDLNAQPEWPDYLRSVAERSGLNGSVVDQHFPATLHS